MLMLILKIISVVIIVSIAVATFVDNYKDYKKDDRYMSLPNCFVLPLFILFGAVFLAMLYCE